jgi:hypothetical protein
VIPAGDQVDGHPGTASICIDDLRIGALLAEGGEGRVYELPLQPSYVFKSYLRPGPKAYLDDLVRWTGARGARVGTACAWPAAVVTDGRGDASGLILPRAPRRFALRHRDGTTRLASLSYLTADPAHRAVAYGLNLPAEVSPERLGLVYALARLIEAFETAEPPVGHGDLSTKNVLWSLQRGPEVFVIDCDNCELYEDGPGVPRRRAMTPNWDDPAVAAGTNPSRFSDRYSLALVFLRVVGAANFPIQARQRDGGAITVDFAMPRRAFDPRSGRAGVGPLRPGLERGRRGAQTSGGRVGGAARGGARLDRNGHRDAHRVGQPGRG